VLSKDFDVVAADAKIAVASAELRLKYGIPMADTIIAATAQLLGIPVVTDDDHITRINEVQSQWV